LPDGSLLAVLGRGNLKVYRLPETIPLVHKANEDTNPHAIFSTTLP
jgi:hypothetical protein